MHPLAFFAVVFFFMSHLLLLYTSTACIRVFGDLDFDFVFWCGLDDIQCDLYSI